MLTHTHTVAILELNTSAFGEIASKLREAGYDHAFIDDGVIDMTGIGVKEATPDQIVTITTTS